MRLIDADALMKIVIQHHDFFSGAMVASDKARRDELHQVMADIVNASTINAITVEWLRSVHENWLLTPDEMEFRDWLIERWQKEQEAQDEPKV